MTIYITHSFNGSFDAYQKVRELVYEYQEEDWENCYVCPVLAFPYSAPNDQDIQRLLSIRLDLLSVCDLMIVASQPDYFMSREIDFAKLIGMEIEYGY